MLKSVYTNIKILIKLKLLYPLSYTYGDNSLEKYSQVISVLVILKRKPDGKLFPNQKQKHKPEHNEDQDPACTL